MSAIRSSRSARDAIKKSLRRLFVIGQRLGVDVLPRHFYSSIPDIAALRASSEWRAPRSMAGVRGLDSQAQIEALKSWFPSPVAERLAGRDIYQEACEANGAVGYGPVEAQLLYAFVATQRPHQVIQIGAGVSTAVILAAAEDHDVELTLTCVDPFPTPYLRRLAAQGRIALVEQPAQDVALDSLTSLGPGGLFFVDSTHTVKPGSEVNRIILEVLPRLSDGVIVHFHDIWFPYDYPRDLLDGTLFFWNESVLLHALLVGNDRMTVQLCSSWMHYHAREELMAVMPRYMPQDDEAGLTARGSAGRHFPSATYLLINRRAYA